MFSVRKPTYKIVAIGIVDIKELLQNYQNETHLLIHTKFA